MQIGSRLLTLCVFILVFNTGYAADSAAPVVESRKVQKNNQCSAADNHLQKSFVVTRFPRLTPNSTNAGALYQVEQEFPQLLKQLLVTKHNALAPADLAEALPLAGASNDSLLAMQVQRIAQKYNSQLVISGEIIDMSMSHPDTLYNPGLYTRFLNGFFDFIETKNRFDKRDRLFSFRVHLRDGFTGQELFTQDYNTYGIWNHKQDVGFGTPLFWASDYGHQIRGLTKKASKEIAAVIQCQPYIAQVDSRPGQTQLILRGGANNGLHAGDTLALYQLVVQGSETQYQQHDVRLVDRNTEIELSEVYPSHSVGIVTGSTFLNGQFLAVMP